MPSRHAVIVALVGALLTAGLAGCLFQNLAPTERLTDQVYSLNEEARWGRLDLAVRRVAPSYRGTFMTSRRSWGRQVSIADTEVSALVLSRETDSATSSVEVNWYDLATMTLRSTMIRQRWARTDDGYLLDEETVIGGDAELLELPEADDESPAESTTEATAGADSAQG